MAKNSGAFSATYSILRGQNISHKQITHLLVHNYLQYVSNISSYEKPFDFITFINRSMSDYPLDNSAKVTIEDYYFFPNTERVVNGAIFKKPNDYRGEINRADFSNCHLLDCSFGGDIKNAVFSNSILSGSKFPWGNTSFSNCDFTKATINGEPYFRNVLFEDCNMQEVKMQDVKFNNCSFKDCDLQKSALKNTTFENGSMEDVQLKGAHLWLNKFQNTKVGNILIDTNTHITCDTVSIVGTPMGAHLFTAAVIYTSYKKVLVQQRDQRLKKFWYGVVAASATVLLASAALLIAGIITLPAVAIGLTVVAGVASIGLTGGISFTAFPYLNLITPTTFLYKGIEEALADARNIYKDTIEKAKLKTDQTTQQYPLQDIQKEIDGVHKKIESLQENIKNLSAHSPVADLKVMYDAIKSIADTLASLELSNSASPNVNVKKVIRERITNEFSALERLGNDFYQLLPAHSPIRLSVGRFNHKLIDEKQSTVRPVNHTLCQPSK